MRIVAITLGSRGDVNPFLALGKELTKRGHEVTIATFKNFESFVIKSGLIFHKISGDADEMVNVLLGNTNNNVEEGVNGLKFLLTKYTDLYDDFYKACEGKDLIIYMQFGALAYHFAEKFKIPVIRTFVFPFDPTKKYYSMKIRTKRDSIMSFIFYYVCYFFMSISSIELVNVWRRSLGLKKWKIYKSYRKMNDKPIMTLYQYDPILADRDVRWGSHIYLTGPWTEEKVTNNNVNKRLKEFLETSDELIYVGFGSMIFEGINDIYIKITNVLVKNRIKALLPLACKSIVEHQYGDTNLFYYTDYVDFDALAGKIDAFVHHGGSGTVHWCLKNAMPQLIFAFGADQYFWGEQCYELGIGPKSMDAKKEIDEGDLEQRILDLIDNQLYKDNIKEMSTNAITDGTKRAVDIIEKHFKII